MVGGGGWGFGRGSCFLHCHSSNTHGGLFHGTPLPLFHHTFQLLPQGDCRCSPRRVFTRVNTHTHGSIHHTIGILFFNFVPKHILFFLSPAHMYGYFLITPRSWLSF